MTSSSPSSGLQQQHTHTHSFNGNLSGTTRVSRYQKGKTNLDFTEARDSEWQWNPLGHMQVCTLLQTDNHASTPPLSFLQAGCPSCRPTNSVNALKALQACNKQHKKGSPYSITECRAPELIPVLGSQPAGDASHKPGGRLPLLSARPAVTPTALKRAATNFAASEQRHGGCEQFA